MLSSRYIPEEKDSKKSDSKKEEVSTSDLRAFVMGRGKVKPPKKK